jgi:hypothetical protein
MIGSRFIIGSTDEKKFFRGTFRTITEKNYVFCFKILEIKLTCEIYKKWEKFRFLIFFEFQTNDREMQECIEIKSMYKRSK